MRHQPVDPYTYRDRRGVPALLAAIVVTAALAVLLGVAALAGRAAANDFHELPPPMVEMKPVPLDLGTRYTYAIKRAWMCGSLKAYYGPGKTHPAVRAWVRHTTDPHGLDRYVLMPGKGPAASDPRNRARCTIVFKVVAKVYPGPGAPTPFPHHR